MRHREVFLTSVLLALAATAALTWAEVRARADDRGSEPNPIQDQVTANEGGSAPAAGPDLGVTYIQRRPFYNAYRLEYQSHDRSGCTSGYDPSCGPGCINPLLVPGSEGDKRWPEPGEPVTFTAHFKNHGTEARPPAVYTWTLDGATVGGGSLPGLAPGEEMSASLKLPWPHGLSAIGLLAPP